MPEVRLEHQKWPRQRRWAAYDAALKRAEPWLRDPSREVRLNPRPRRSLISESLGMDVLLVAHRSRYRKVEIRDITGGAP